MPLKQVTAIRQPSCTLWQRHSRVPWCYIHTAVLGILHAAMQALHFNLVTLGGYKCGVSYCMLVGAIQQNMVALHRRHMMWPIVKAVTDCRCVRLGSHKLRMPSVPRVASLRVSLQYFTSLTLVCITKTGEQNRRPLQAYLCGACYSTAQNMSRSISCIPHSRFTRARLKMYNSLNKHTDHAAVNDFRFNYLVHDIMDTA